jgi:enamine deaminase RidA (YjgF/YER057c/UK114 family)
MTEASAQVPTTANFINPEAMHRPPGYTHVVEVIAGRPVYIAGQVALDRTGAVVGPGDIRAQARQVFDNLQAALQSVGASFEQVVKLNYYLVDATQLPAVREVRDDYVNTAQPPASTAVEVSRLVLDDLLIEVEAVAIIASPQLVRTTV